MENRRFGGERDKAREGRGGGRGAASEPKPTLSLHRVTWKGIGGGFALPPRPHHESGWCVVGIPETEPGRSPSPWRGQAHAGEYEVVWNNHWHPPPAPNGPPATTGPGWNRIKLGKQVKKLQKIRKSYTKSMAAFELLSWRVLAQSPNQKANTNRGPIKGGHGGGGGGPKLYTDG